MEKQWQELTPLEKQEELFQRWLSPKDPEGNDIKYKSPQAEKVHKERVTRLKDAIQLKKLPDRVPVIPMLSFFPAFYAGLTPQEAMYDYDKLYAAGKKYLLDFDPDVSSGIGIAAPGKVFDILDYKQYAWPGHGVSPNHSYQCLEKEYMTADEYDALIKDPSHFFDLPTAHIRQAGRFQDAAQSDQLPGTALRRPQHDSLWPAPGSGSLQDHARGRH